MKTLNDFVYLLDIKPKTGQTKVVAGGGGGWINPTPLYHTSASVAPCPYCGTQNKIQKIVDCEGCDRPYEIQL
jgi:hypothetical protein